MPLADTKTKLLLGALVAVLLVVVGLFIKKVMKENNKPVSHDTPPGQDRPNTHERDPIHNDTPTGIKGGADHDDSKVVDAQPEHPAHEDTPIRPMCPTCVNGQCMKDEATGVDSCHCGFGYMGANCDVRNPRDKPSDEIDPKKGWDLEWEGIAAKSGLKPGEMIQVNLSCCKADGESCCSFLRAHTTAMDGFDRLK